MARPDEAGLRTSSKPGLRALPAGKVRRPARAGVLWGGMGLLAVLVAVGVYLRPAGNGSGNGAPVSDQAKVPLTPPLAGELPAPPASAVTSTPAPAASEATAPVPVPFPAPPAPASTPAPAPASSPAPAIAVEPPAPSAPAPAVSSAPVGTLPAPLAKAPATRKPPAASIAPPAALALPAPRPAAPKPNPEQAVTRSPRCALILQKAGVDEPISADDRAFLKSSCR